MPELPGVSLDQLPSPKAASGQLGTAPTSVGFQTEPIGNFAMPGPGQVVPPSSAFEGQDWFGVGTGAGLLFRSLNNATAREMAAGADVFGTGEPSPPEPTLLPDAANEKYGIPGKLSFSAPVPESVAQSMLTAKQAEIAREDAAARTPPGFWPSAARLGASFVAGLTDPLNAAAMFIPGVGEERFAGLFGETLAGRIAARGAAGAVSGAAVQAPLVGLRYGLSGGEQADYDSYQALIDLASGAGLGALFHVGGGAFGDALTGRFKSSVVSRVVEADPEVRSGALQAALAATVGDRPVEVRPIIAAVRESNMREVLRARIIEMQREAGTLRAEAEAIPTELESVSSPQSMIVPPQVDDVTLDRLNAIEDELTDDKNPPSATRRADLLSEHRMLTLGDAPRSELEASRSDAQREGLLIAAQRIEGRIAELRSTPPDSVPEQFDSAVRSATEPRPVPQAAEAQAATQAKPDALLRDADQTIADHQAFFQEAEAAGALTDEHRAELEQIAELPKEAGAIRQAFMTAAACIARGFV